MTLEQPHSQKLFSIGGALLWHWKSPNRRWLVVCSERRRLWEWSDCIRSVCAWTSPVHAGYRVPVVVLFVLVSFSEEEKNILNLREALFLDVAALKSNSPIRAYRSSSPSVSRARNTPQTRRTIFSVPLPLWWSSLFLGCFFPQHQQLIIPLQEERNLQRCCHQDPSLENNLVIVWCESSLLEGCIFFPLSSAVQRKVHNSFFGSPKVCEREWGRASSPVCTIHPFRLVEPSVMKSVWSKSKWNLSVASWFILTGPVAH